MASALGSNIRLTFPACSRPSCHDAGRPAGV